MPRWSSETCRRSTPTGATACHWSLSAAHCRDCRPPPLLKGIKPSPVWRPLGSSCPTARGDAGDIVRARLAGDGWEATSQDVVIEAPPADGALQARATIAHLTRDAAALQQVSDEMTAIDADGHAGYFYRGLALELTGDLEGAETALTTALERLSAQPASGELEEPPILLFRLFRALARVRESRQ